MSKGLFFVSFSGLGFPFLLIYSISFREALCVLVELVVWDELIKKNVLAGSVLVIGTKILIDKFKFQPGQWRSLSHKSA